MAIADYFQIEISKVDPGKQLVFYSGTTGDVQATGYEEFEYSYSGLTIIGGSDLACEIGAAALLDALGFRFWTPTEEFTVRPESIRTDLVRAKATNWIRNIYVSYTYGQDWFNIAAKAELRENLTRWRTLNACHNDAYDAGHNWGTFINANAAYINPAWMTDSDSFALDTLSPTEIDSIAKLYAAWKLSLSSSATRRTSIDPSDSDLNVSDDVYPFCQQVVDYINNGTPAVGPYPAQSGRPNVMCGVYAYSKHRLAPTLPTSNIFVLVALGFNSTGLTYDELFATHAAKHDQIGIREYLDTVTWNGCKPLINGRTKVDYFDRYDIPVNTSGALACKAEGSGDWLVNMVMMRLWVKKCRTGVADYAETLEELVSTVFGGDPKVKELYEFWSDPFEKFHLWNLKKSFDIINGMQTGWYKRHYQNLMVILWEALNLPDQTPKAQQTVPDTSAYRTAINSLLGKITGVRLHEIMHSYGLMRRYAEQNLAANYPDLKFDANPTPAWQNINAIAPTEAEFDAAYAAIQAAALRDLELDSSDLVVVQGITPEVSATTPATKFYCEGVMSLMFVGPGTVTITPASGTPPVALSDEPPSITTWPEGVHSIQAEGNFIAECTGGYLFLDGFPQVRKDPDGGNPHWLYIPDRCDGAVDIQAASRVRVFDGSGQFDIYPSNNASYASPANLGPGQIKIDNTNTSNFMYILNANRYVSMSPYIALLPRTIAEEDFPARVKIRRG